MCPHRDKAGHSTLHPASVVNGKVVMYVCALCPAVLQAEEVTEKMLDSDKMMHKDDLTTR